MTKQFIERVIKEGIVDTKNYRYTTKEVSSADGQSLQIVRLPLESLDTTDAIDGWEVVKVIN